MSKKLIPVPISVKAETLCADIQRSFDEAIPSTSNDVFGPSIHKRPLS